MDNSADATVPDLVLIVTTRESSGGSPGDLPIVPAKWQAIKCRAGIGSPYQCDLGRTSLIDGCILYRSKVDNEVLYRTSFVCMSLVWEVKLRERRMAKMLEYLTPEMLFSSCKLMLGQEIRGSRLSFPFLNNVKLLFSKSLT